jgi:hypothetical protein
MKEGRKEGIRDVTAVGIISLFLEAAWVYYICLLP